MIKLRPYQDAMIDSVRQSYRDGHQRVLVVSPTGSGKTVVFCYIAQQARANRRRTMILVHRQELVDQTSRTLTGFSVPHGVIAAGRTQDNSEPIQIASVQTLIRRIDKVSAPDLIVIDECFPAGTMVDGMPIESINPDDLISSFNHETNQIETHRVVNVMSREYHGPWFKITDTDGAEFICTENHPIFLVGKGYVPAKCLTSHDLGLFLIKYEMPELRKDQTTRQKTPKTSIQVLLEFMQIFISKRSDKTASDAGYELQRMRESSKIYESTPRIALRSKRNSLLLNNLLKRFLKKSIFRNCQENKCKDEICYFNENDSFKSNAKSGECRENEKENDRKNISFTRWKWSTNKTSVKDSRIDRTSNRIRNINNRSKFPEFTEMLQSRFGALKNKAGNRSGRKISSPQKMEVSRPKEDRGFKLSRLASVEIYQRGSGSRPEWVPEKNTVYNIHIEKNHNYFAEGILVHNCHHAIAGSWRRVVERFASARVLGVTATPERLDGKGLRDVFSDLVRGPEVRDLVRDGHLSAPLYYAPPQHIDMASVQLRRGDYDQKGLESVMDAPKITGDAVDHYRRICAGKPAVVFCVSIAHAEHVAEEFRRAGFRAATIDGTLSPEDRRDRVRSLGNGRLQVLTSCEIINEGFDLPIVSVGILLRPTQSLGLHLQQIGRVLRPAPGKDRAVILDHAGNLARHGLAEDIRDWSLDGAEKRKKKAKAEDTIKTRQCPECFACHPWAASCQECGYEYVTDGRQIEVVGGDLVAIDTRFQQCGGCQHVHSRWDASCPKCGMVHDAVRARKKEQSRAQTLDELVALGKRRGYANPYGWARHTWNARQGRK